MGAILSPLLAAQDTTQYRHIPVSTPTYTRDVSRIMRAKCENCHQPNAIAPFPLQDYASVRAYAEDIRVAVESDKMPPWKPLRGFGDFRDPLSLTAQERATILRWVNSGAPKGDDADLPERRLLNESPFQLGSPDLGMVAPPYTPPAGVTDTYRCFSLPTQLKNDAYINASEALPGVRTQVHHILLFLDTAGESAKLDGADGQPGYTCFGGPGITIPTSLDRVKTSLNGLVGAWVPGFRVQRYDPGIGSLIPANARIVMQIHYHLNGRPQQDQTSVGMYFAPEGSVKHQLFTLPLANTGFLLKAGEPDVQVNAKFQLPSFVAAHAIFVAPHMHLLGRTIQMNVRHPDNSLTPLVRIDDWDFNWQGEYAFTAPVALRPLDTVELTSHFDNSENNPNNPNRPLVDVRWGERTTDEMCLGYIGFTFDNELLAKLLFVHARR